MKHKPFKFLKNMNIGGLESRNYRVGIVVATFNGDISNGLLEGTLKGLAASNVKKENIAIYTVDGCVEIPIVAQRLADKKIVDVIICLGSVIKGDTPHFEYVCQSVTQGISTVSLTAKIPVIFGVLTTLNYDQALKRASDDDNNKGYEAAQTALKTINLLDQIWIMWNIFMPFYDN